jgi:hypothetical protein
MEKTYFNRKNKGITVLKFYFNSAVNDFSYKGPQNLKIFLTRLSLLTLHEISLE